MIEVVDRLFIMIDNMDVHVADHPSICANEEYREQVFEVIEAMCKLYTSICDGLPDKEEC